jgi:DNA mismatch endonuclease (patch repair protein)
MRSNKRRDTSIELNVRQRLHSAGFRYRVDYAPIAGLRRRADVVFTGIRLAVFIDGCFWHGCPIHYSAPKTNADFWRTKVDSNRFRDLDTNSKLEGYGWVVSRYWEHQSTDEIFRSIANMVTRLHQADR